VPRQPDPALEQRILEAASRLWARGGEKALTMRAVAKAAGTTTPTVYERYRDRDDILRALRLQTRREMFDALSRTRTLREAVQCKLQFALDHRHAYQMLMDGVAKPPSLHEPWPSFNLMRERLAAHLGGTPRQHTRLTLAVWSLTYGTAMIIIRGQFRGSFAPRLCTPASTLWTQFLNAHDRNTLPPPARNGRRISFSEKAGRVGSAMARTTGEGQG